LSNEFKPEDLDKLLDDILGNSIVSGMTNESKPLLEEKVWHSLMWEELIMKGSPQVAESWITGIANKMISGTVPSKLDLKIIGIALKWVVKRNESLDFLIGPSGQGRHADGLLKKFQTHQAVLQAHLIGKLPLSFPSESKNAFSQAGKQVFVSASTAKDYYYEIKNLIKQTRDRVLLVDALQRYSQQED
jgi:hypothetical protein